MDIPELQREPDQAEFDELQQHLVDFNISNHGYSDVFKAAKFVRDDDGALIGGVYAYGWGGCCQVELLWVAEGHRGTGLGSDLMAAVEAEARAKGCSKMILDTFSYQAPDFYAKLGFEQAGTIDDFPEGHRYYVMFKRL